MCVHEKLIFAQRDDAWPNQKENLYVANPILNKIF